MRVSGRTEGDTAGVVIRLKNGVCPTKWYIDPVGFLPYILGILNLDIQSGKELRMGQIP